MPHNFLNRQVELHQQRLLRSGYSCVLFTEIDEMIVPDPDQYPGGLKEYLNKFAQNSSLLHIRPQGYEMVHRNFSSVSNEREKNIDWTKSILAQRKFVFPSPGYSKPLLSKIPLLYVPGFHTTVGVVVETDTSLRLFHLHSVDYEYCNTREQSKFIS